MNKETTVIVCKNKTELASMCEENETKLKCSCGWEGVRSQGVEIDVKCGSKTSRYDHTYTSYHGCPVCGEEAKIE